MYFKINDHVPKHIVDKIVRITGQKGPSVGIYPIALTSPSFLVIEIMTVPTIMNTVPRYSQNLTYSAR